MDFKKILTRGLILGSLLSLLPVSAWALLTLLYSLLLDYLF